MLRLLTPFMLISISAISYAIYLCITEDDLTWGIFLVIGMLISGMVFFALDFILRKWLNKYIKIVFAEVTLMLLAVLIYSYPFCITKKLVLPPNFNKEFVTIIYGVENSKELSFSPINCWSNEVEIPENGIVLTASDYKENLKRTAIRMDSGIYLNSEKTGEGFVKFPDSKFTFEGQIFRYRTWRLQNKHCCSVTSDQVDSYRKEIKIKFEKIKANSYKIK